MKKILILMAEGCEEIEALTPVDLLRRAGLHVDTASINGVKEVTGSHNITFMTDLVIDEIKAEDYDAVILPGGAPGYVNLKNSDKVKDIILSFNKKEKLVAAICAAPTVLASFGVLEGRKATCYPGMEGDLTGAKFIEEPVVIDGNFITSRGVGTAIDFSLAIVAYFIDENKAKELAKSVVYNKDR